MDYRMRESNVRANIGREHTVLLAAGTAAITMACLKRILVMFFAEQWRVRVFLVLNLVLLAIFFTSAKPTQEKDQNNISPVVKAEKKKKRRVQQRQDGCPAKVSATQQCVKKVCKRTAEEKEEEELYFEAEDGEDAEAKLSNEELNERAEAFIAMFRQHLASDARKR